MIIELCVQGVTQIWYLRYLCRLCGSGPGALFHVMIQLVLESAYE